MKKILKKWRTILSILLVIIITFGIINSTIVKADTQDISGTMNTIPENTDQENVNLENTNLPNKEDINSDDTNLENISSEEEINSNDTNSDNTNLDDIPSDEDFNSEENISENLENNTFDSSNYPAAAQEIISGNTYKIVSALDSSYVWNVRGNSYYNGRNMQLYKDNGTNPQKFVFLKQKDGSFKIKSTNSSKMLESNRGGIEEGTDVCQFDNNNDLSQLWDIIPTEDGFYYLRNKCNDLVASVADETATDGANIKMYSLTETNNQKFMLVSTAPFANATYKIVSALNRSYVWHIKSGSHNDGATVHLYEDNNNINTPKFIFTMQKNGSYIIENTNSGKTIECKDGGKQKGTDICQNKRTNNAEQQWKLIPTEDGFYYLQNQCNMLVADAAGGKAGNNINIQMYTPNKTLAQKFDIMVTFPLVNGTYVLESALNNSYVWDIAGASKSDKGNLQLYKYSGNNAQKFIVQKHYGEWDYYTIKNVNSNKLVECNKINTNIWQYSEAKTVDTAQLWKPISAGNGYYYLANWYSGLVAGVNNSNAVNRANIQLYKKTNNNSFKFKFTAPSNKKEITNNYPNGLLFPIKGKIQRSSNVKTKGYYCDYVAGKNTPVYAPADGKVQFRQSYATKYNKLASYGNNIIFTSSDKKYKVICAHFNSFKNVDLVYKSSLSYPCGANKYSCKTAILSTRNVKKGDLIGYTGKTGNASGFHIHIEIYKNGKSMDPFKTFTTWK